MPTSRPPTFGPGYATPLQETPAAGDSGGPDLWATKWIWFAVLISLVVTVLSSVFFAWLGRRLAQLHNQPLEARQEQPAYD